MKLLGTKIGMLTVTKVFKEGIDGVSECTCDCGRVVALRNIHLINRDMNSCGCCSYEQARKNAHYKRHPKSTIVGQTFGRLVVLKEVDSVKNKRYWLCRCSCGNEVIIEQGNLKQGLSRSCGCLRNEIAEKNHPKSLKGLSKTRLYQTWYNMKDRCYNKANKNYKYYGELGVIVCSEWKDNFLAFYEWAISHGYEETLTIDRINPYGNYEPSNCRWATRYEQAHNQRKNYKP